MKIQNILHGNQSFKIVHEINANHIRTTKIRLKENLRKNQMLFLCNCRKLR